MPRTYRTLASILRMKHKEKTVPLHYEAQHPVHWLCRTPRHITEQKPMLVRILWGVQGSWILSGQAFCFLPNMLSPVSSVQFIQSSIFTLHSLIHSFIYPLTCRHSFTHSFIHFYSLVNACIHWLVLILFTHSSTHLYSFICSLTCRHSFIHSFIHIHSSLPVFTDSFSSIYSFIHSLMHLHTHSFILIHSLIHLLTHSLCYSFTHSHWFIPEDIQRPLKHVDEANMST